ncbi:MAG: FHA domain-containing protein [Anaerolineae bacterium]|nr:FHA domain-containing protein [Anaerolineae bacterium]
MNEIIITVSVMSGPQDGRVFRLPLPRTGEEKTVLIGRSEDSDIPLGYDSQVSRQHAKLLCAYNDETMADISVPERVRVQLVDAGSRNGTYIDGRRLRDEIVLLLPGQLFRVGRTWLRLDP